MPCHPAKARKLLDKGKAAVYRLYPFTIILNDEVEADNQEIALKIDPGSPTTGLALVADFEGGKQVILAADLEHRGQHIGRVAVRLTGSFRVGTVDGINTKYCTLIQQGDGYDFMFSSAIG